MSSNNVTSEVFANVAPSATATGTNWTVIGLFLMIFAIVLGIAYFVYITYFANTSYPFHQDMWSKLWQWSGASHSSYTPQLIRPEQDALSKVVTSDHTKLTGETPSLIGTPTVIQPPHSQPAATPADVDKVAAKQPDVKESWCFVGEDLSGRYCVKVPNDKVCTQGRVYHSRSDCEMAAANHLPAGVINDNGVGLQPLSTMNIE